MNKQAVRVLYVDLLYSHELIVLYGSPKPSFFFQAWWLDLPTNLWSGILMPTPPCIQQLVSAHLVLLRSTLHYCVQIPPLSYKVRIISFIGIQTIIWQVFLEQILPTSVKHLCIWLHLAALGCIWSASKQFQTVNKKCECTFFGYLATLVGFCTNKVH